MKIKEEKEDEQEAAQDGNSFKAGMKVEAEEK